MSSRQKTTLLAALGLEESPQLIAIVGGGGKSSLMFALGEQLPGRVVLTTTTRIFAAQIELAPEACSTEDPDFEAVVARAEKTLLVTGGTEGERATGVPSALPEDFLTQGWADWVVVEADGSRMLPAKAPAEHEPVIPRATTLVVAVAGIDCLEGPIHERVHRPERVSALTRLRESDALTPEALATLLTSSDGGRKNVEERTRFVVLLNKVETESRRNAARKVAAAALEHPGVDAVAIGALRSREGDRPWELHTRGR